MMGYDTKNYIQSYKNNIDTTGIYPFWIYPYYLINISITINYIFLEDISY
jgi:hypothetical protein